MLLVNACCVVAFGILSLQRQSSSAAAWTVRCGGRAKKMRSFPAIRTFRQPVLPTFRGGRRNRSPEGLVEPRLKFARVAGGRSPRLRHQRVFLHARKRAEDTRVLAGRVVGSAGSRRASRARDGATAFPRRTSYEYKCGTCGATLTTSPPTSVWVTSRFPACNRNGPPYRYDCVGKTVGQAAEVEVVTPRTDQLRQPQAAEHDMVQLLALVDIA